MEQDLNGHSPPVYVHCGDYWNFGKRSRGISRDEALWAPADAVAACGACQPDTELRYFDG
ncbi:DUF6233 domain-containing protein [Streptomyces sp. NPDC047028]|uniref:DUF6233 domain-containing protein n=1 Tax=Streptomyces sp. NPDC047028 TaxID=3155793 RepID=UPI0033DB0340